jgi:hypothetical protein
MKRITPKQARGIRRHQEDFDAYDAADARRRQAAWERWKRSVTRDLQTGVEHRRPRRPAPRSEGREPTSPAESSALR